MAAAYEELYRLGVGIYVRNEATAGLNEIRKSAKSAWGYVDKISKALRGLDVGGVAGMERMTRAMSAAANAQSRAAREQMTMLRAREASEARILRMERQITLAGQRRIDTGGGLGYKTAAMQAVGAAGIGAAGSGLSSAMELTQALTSIRIATSGSDDDMARIKNQAFAISNMTAQSVSQSANVMKVLATSGLNDPGQLLGLSTPIAKFADVQFGTRGVGFEESAKQAMQIAHLYQAYTPQAIKPILDQLTKLSFMMPDDLSRYVTQAGYYVPALRRLGVDQDQSLVAGAFLDRMGLGRGKGGTGLQNFVLQQMKALQITGHVQGGRQSALKDLGLLNDDGSSRYYKNGQFDIFGSLKAIDDSISKRVGNLRGHARDVVEQKAITDIQRALNVTGGRIGFLGTKEAVDQLHQMIELLKKLPGVDAAQREVMDTPGMQLQRFRTNFVSLLTDVFDPWMDDLKATFHWLADVTGDIASWMRANKEAAAVIAAILTVTSGAVMGVATAQLWGFGAAVMAVGTAARAQTALLAAQGVVMGGAEAAAVGGSSFGLLRTLSLAGALGGAGTVTGAVLSSLMGPAAIVVGTAAAAALAVKFTPLGHVVDDTLKELTKFHSGIGDMARFLDDMLHRFHLVDTPPISPPGKTSSVHNMRVAFKGKNAQIGPATAGGGFWEDIGKTLGDNIWAFFHPDKGELDKVHNVLGPVVNEELYKKQQKQARSRGGYQHFAQNVGNQAPAAAHTEMKFGNIIIQVPPGTSQQQADSLFRQFVEKLQQYYQSGSRTQGDVATSPLMPAIAGQANYTPGGGVHP